MKPSLIPLLLAAAFALTACGNKGPLVLPEKPAPQPATPAAPATDSTTPTEGEKSDTSSGTETPADATTTAPAPTTESTTPAESPPSTQP